jgi:hypothetical protein
MKPKKKIDLGKKKCTNALGGFSHKAKKEKSVTKKERQKKKKN